MGSAMDDGKRDEMERPRRGESWGGECQRDCPPPPPPLFRGSDT